MQAWFSFPVHIFRPSRGFPPDQIKKGDYKVCSPLCKANPRGLGVRKTRGGAYSQMCVQRYNLNYINIAPLNIFLNCGKRHKLHYPSHFLRYSSVVLNTFTLLCNNILLSVCRRYCQFSKTMVPIPPSAPPPRQYMKVLDDPQLHQYLILWVLLILAILGKVQLCIIVVLICILSILLKKLVNLENRGQGGLLPTCSPVLFKKFSLIFCFGNF